MKMLSACGPARYDKHLIQLCAKVNVIVAVEQERKKVRRKMAFSPLHIFKTAFHDAFGKVCEYCWL